MFRFHVYDALSILLYASRDPSVLNCVRPSQRNVCLYMNLTVFLFYVVFYFSQIVAVV